MKIEIDEEKLKVRKRSLKTTLRHRNRKAYDRKRDKRVTPSDVES